MAVIAVLGALHGRASTGRGCFIDLALADAPLPQLVFSLAEFGRPTGENINAILGGGAAYYGVYRVRDGFATLGAIEPKFWARFCAAAGAHGLDRAPKRGPPANCAEGRIGGLFRRAEPG